MNEEDKTLLERAMAINDRLILAVKEAKSTLDASKPIMEEHGQILTLVKDYLARIREYRNKTEEDLEIVMPNAHDYMMMIASIVSSKI